MVTCNVNFFQGVLVAMIVLFPFYVFGTIEYINFEKQFTKKKYQVLWFTLLFGWIKYFFREPLYGDKWR